MKKSDQSIRQSCKIKTGERFRRNKKGREENQVEELRMKEKKRVEKEIIEKKKKKKKEGIIGQFGGSKMG